jgi:hypothetical protein
MLRFDNRTSFVGFGLPSKRAGRRTARRRGGERANHRRLDTGGEEEPKRPRTRRLVSEARGGLEHDAARAQDERDDESDPRRGGNGPDAGVAEDAGEASGMPG